MLRREVACGGLRTKVTSVCQLFAARPRPLSTGSTLGAPSTAGTVGWAPVISPKCRTKACWPESSRCTSSKSSVLCSFRASRSAVTVASSSGLERSTPETRAPMVAVTLVIRRSDIGAFPSVEVSDERGRGAAPGCAW